MADPYLSDLDFDEDGIYRERHETGLTFSYFIPFIDFPATMDLFLVFSN